jgi:proteasome accessory factor C
MAKTGRKPGATDNLLLLLALVPYVLDRGEVSVAEAAAQFNRSEEDITKAVELIACAGIPGDNLAYSHLDLFDIDWDLFESEKTITFWNTVALDHQPRFSAREASALIAGLQYLQAHPAYAGRGDVEQVMDKIRKGSGQGPADRIAVGAPALEEHLRVLNESLEARVSVQMMYHNKRGEALERLVDPVVLEARDTHWYLRAWCHERQALRTFRVDHIESLSQTDLTHQGRESFLDDISPDLFEPSPNDISVTLEVHPGGLPLIADYLPRGYQPPAGEQVLHVEIPFAHYGSLTRLVASHPGVIRVISPPSARAAVADFANQALAQYS